MKNALPAILGVVQPPVAARGRTGDWTQVEERLGKSLPSDYKQLIERFGFGAFGEFLIVANPFVSSGRNNVIDANVGPECARASLEGSAGVPPSAELLIAAKTDNGDYVVWHTQGKPDDWPVIAFELRGVEVIQFASLTDFLARWLSGELEETFVGRPEPTFVAL